MSISELLPAVHSLSDPDKLRLIRILAEDLSGQSESVLAHIVGDCPVWSPHDAFAAANTLLEELQSEESRQNSNG